MTWVEHDSATTDPAETDITFVNLKARVIAECDNLPSQHPQYPFIGENVNEAKDELLRMAFGMSRRVLDLLPRLQNWRWSQTTVSAQNYLALPATMIFLQWVSYTKLTTTYSPSATQTYKMTEESDAELFGFRVKTTTGWPSIYRRAGTRLEFWPTPSNSPTDYTTKLVVGGVRYDNDLSADGDTLLMDLPLQRLVIDLAAAITMKRANWEDAPAKLGEVTATLQGMLNPSVAERRRVVNTRIAGTPR